jgi:Fungal specific transcription factor domain
VEWISDPLTSEEELVVELMNIYFNRLESATLYMLPKKPFMLWLTDRYTRKSFNDLMLIYSILAISTVFSSNPDHRQRGKEFATISRHACDRRQFSLQLVQSRLLLALYYYANGNQPDCWDFCGGALRVATGMKLNLEIERTEESNANFFPYNLNRNGYAECRRRTFWSCYIMERFNSFSNGHISMIRPEDIFLRLPCDVKSFEEQIEVHNPYFDHSTPHIKSTYSNIGPMAYLVNIISIWGDVMANIYRSSEDPFATDSTTYKAFYEVITSRLEAWHSSLPDCVSFSPENLVKASHFGTLGAFITIHSLYQSTQMKLNRHVSPDIPPPEQLEANVRRAHHHAEALMQIADSLTKRYITTGEGTALKVNDGLIPFLSPFIGFAIVNAVDTLSAKGYLSRLPESPLIQSAIRVLDDLAKYWQSARSQRKLVSTLLADLIADPIGWRGPFEAKIQETM